MGRKLSDNIPSGWVLLPETPTPNMVGAWYRYKSGFRFTDEEPATDTSDYGAYAAMLAAAPTPDLGPEGFFDDPFDKPLDTDTPLQSSAREAGWALSSLVDEIKFEKRQQVVNIINRLSAALVSSALVPSPALEANQHGKSLVGANATSSWMAKWADADARANKAEAVVEGKLRAALGSFVTGLEDWADENGWTEVAAQNDRICDWVGPSDWRAAVAALSSPTQEEESGK